MKLKKYAIKDVQADAFQLPMYRERDEIAIRDFENACVDPNLPFAKNPDDYVLYYIGEYDDENATGSYVDPLRLITGVDACRNRAEKAKRLQALQGEIEELRTH